MAELLLFSQIFSGIFLLNFFDKHQKFSFLEKIASIFVFGFVMSSFIILILSIILKSLILSIFIFIQAFIILFFLNFSNFGAFFKEIFREIKKSLNRDFFLKNYWVFFLIFFLSFYYFFYSTVLFKDKNGNLRGILIGWGDTALHINLIKRFSVADPFSLSHPLISNKNLTYPFLIDFISGIYHALGKDLVFSFKLPTIFLGFSFIILIFSFISNIFLSRKIAILGLIVILMGGGLGFVVFFKDLKNFYQMKRNIFEIPKFFLSDFPHEYTHLDNKTGGKPSFKDTEDNIVWIVPLISFFGHQRSFILGFAIFSLILIAIYHYGKEFDFWRFGILAGLLPFSHSHSFLALFFLMSALFWFFLKNWKGWVLFALFAFLFSLPQILYFKKDSQFLKAIRIEYGWIGCECNVLNFQNFKKIFLFWAKNFGIIFFLWILNFFFFFKKYLPFNFTSIFLFLLPNIFIFQPWSFDNGKILFYWWVLAIIFAFLPTLIFLKKIKFGKIFIFFLVFFSILSGVLDVYERMIFGKKLYAFGYSDSDFQNQWIAKWIEENTLPNSVFLTFPSVDSIPLFLAGRPIYLTFSGWLWSEGISGEKETQNMIRILSGNLNLACDEKIDYILLDDNLRNFYPFINENELEKKTKLVFQMKKRSLENIKILKVLCGKN